MKKLLKVSLMAMLVAAPFAARAEGEPMASTDAPYAGVDATTNTHVATTSYVNGAYNDVIGKINKVATTAAAGQTEQQVKTAITNAAGTTTNTSLSGNNGVLTVEVDGTHVTRDSTTGALTLSGTDITNLGKAATALQSSDVTSTYAADGTAPVNGTAVASAIATAGTNYASAAQGATADATAATIATYGDIVTHNSSEYATAAQGAKADTAIQAADLATYGFNVYGNWATPTTATGSVTVTNSGLQQ